MIIMGPNSPGPAEVIRACQRDKEFINRLKQDIDEMVLEVFGQRVWMRCQEYSQYCSSLIYYSLTHLMKNQTLGEEYVGVFLVNGTRTSLPSRKALSLMIFAQVLGTPFINYVIKLIENFNQRQTEMARLPKYLNQLLRMFLQIGRVYQHFAPLLSQLHLALFYFNGQFYHFSKRLCGVHYLLTRQYYGNTDAASKRNLNYLRWVSIINLSITALFGTYSFVSQKMKRSHSYQLAPSLQLSQGNDEPCDSSASDLDPTKKCSLCLEARRSSSVTPCGHMFCWECIIDWLRTEGACPICRESVLPSRVVPLQNLS